MEVPAIITIILLTLVSYLIGSPAHSPEQWISHLKRFNEFKCRSPQPRSVNVKELFGSSSFHRYQPESTVLHRCESAGCCPRDQFCSPDKTEDVELIFFVYDKDTRHKYVTVTAKNHTMCRCERIHDNPK